MALTLEPCRSLADCMELNDFLRAGAGVYPSLYVWEPRRWEGQLFHRNHADLVATRARVALEVVLAKQDGNVVGAVTPEYPGGVFLQAAPNDEVTQAALLDWAIANLRQNSDAGGQWLEVWCQDGDELRTRLLSDRGFSPTSEHQYVRLRDSAEPAAAPIADGYSVRSYSTFDDTDSERMANLLNAAFGRDFHSAEEYANFSALAPSFEEALQVVAIAPDGSFAAHAGFTIHRAENFGVMEPVATHPDHQNLGLARAAIAEGVNRCLAAGVTRLYVGAWYSNPVSNHVYDAMGFAGPVASDRIWRRDWSAD